MDTDVYRRMDALEQQHWWFSGRRRILERVIGQSTDGKAAPRILEAGCGSGGNLSMLRRLGSVYAFEYEETARAAAESKSGLPVVRGALPDAVPFGDDRYDVIGIFDVLEHVEDDVGSLRVLGQRLEEDGKLIVTVPAFPALWSRHDETHHHFRRYTRASLTERAHEAGLRVSYSSYYNFFMFPFAVGMRAIKRVLGRESPDDAMPGRAVNQALTSIFGFERHLLGRFRLPVGLSVIAVLERP